MAALCDEDVQRHVVNQFSGDLQTSHSDQVAEHYAKRLQAAWRAKKAQVATGNLVHFHQCEDYLSSVRSGLVEMNCALCEARREQSIHAWVEDHSFAQTSKLLFKGADYVSLKDDHGTNWNKRFQKAMELPEHTELEKRHKYLKLAQINQDFVSTAVDYAKVIISELFLHVKDKSIRPVTLGVAGGMKFFWRGILFKVANGGSEPYRGSDEAASKAAGADLTGANHFFSGTGGLRVALQALIDYKGFRVSAHAVLPIADHTLKVGSRDGGRTVRLEDSRVLAEMRVAAERLNLAPHPILVTTTTTTDTVSGPTTQLRDLPCAVDVEGHQGKDGRCYVVDTARTFPPEALGHTPHLPAYPEEGSMIYLDMRECGRYATIGGRSLSESELSELPQTCQGRVLRSRHDGDLELRPAAYDVVLFGSEGSMQRLVIVRDCPSSLVIQHQSNRPMTLFWRFLRPEFVESRGKEILEEVDVLAEQVRTADGHTGTAGRDSIKCMAEHAIHLVEGGTVSIAIAPGNTHGSLGDVYTKTLCFSMRVTHRELPTPDEYYFRYSDAKRFHSRLESLGFSQLKPPAFPTSSLKESFFVCLSADQKGRRCQSMQNWMQFVVDRIRSFDVETTKVIGIFLHAHQVSKLLHPILHHHQKLDENDPNNNNNTAAAAQDDDRLSTPSKPQPALNSRHVGFKLPPLTPDFTDDDSTQSEQVKAKKLSSSPALSWSEEIESLEDASEVAAMQTQHHFLSSPSPLKTPPPVTQHAGDDDDSMGDPPPSLPPFFSPTSAPPRPGKAMVTDSGAHFLSEEYSPGGQRQDEQDEQDVEGTMLHAYDTMEGELLAELEGSEEVPLVLSGYAEFSCIDDRLSSSPQRAVEEEESQAPITDDGYGEFVAFPDKQEQEEEVVKEEELMPTEEQSGSGGGRRGPLCPDGLSMFMALGIRRNLAAERSDDERRVISLIRAANKSVLDATQLLVEEVAPAAASYLLSLKRREIASLDVDLFMHSHGLNLRHLGLVRSFLPSHFHHPSVQHARKKLLLEIVSRTLKGLLKDYQRKWMRAERTSSTRGMFTLLSQFLNLVSGAHPNADAFWRSTLPRSIFQRFGECALSEQELSDLSQQQPATPKQTTIQLLNEGANPMHGDPVPPVTESTKVMRGWEHELRSSPTCIQALLERLMRLVGVQLTEAAWDAMQAHFDAQHQQHSLIGSRGVPASTRTAASHTKRQPPAAPGVAAVFEFLPSDIKDLEPRVKCLHAIDLYLAESFHAEAVRRKHSHGVDDSQAQRLMDLARAHLHKAQRSKPHGLKLD